MDIDKSSWPLVESLLAEQRFAALATQGADAPYTSLVAFAVTPDFRKIIFPTRSGTRKFTNLEANPRVALLIDNRSNSADDYRNAAAITVIGSVSVERGPEEAERRGLLLARHPLLAEFLAASDCRIATATVTEYRLVTRFETVARLVPATRE